MTAFETRWVLLCDYANQYVDGKYAFHGVYTEDIVMHAVEPPMFSGVTIVVCLKPSLAEFEFNFAVTKPDGTDLIRSKGRIDAPPGTTIEDTDRVTMPFPVPAIPFPGFGRYLIKLSEGSTEPQVVHTFLILPPPSDLG